MFRGLLPAALAQANADSAVNLWERSMPVIVACEVAHAALVDAAWLASDPFLC